jgi:hypothetical protein
MNNWTYSPEMNASFATQRLVWQWQNDWPIFKKSRTDAKTLAWLRSLHGSRLADYCSLVPRLELGLYLEPDHHVRAESIRRKLHEAMDFSGGGVPADRGVSDALRRALDDYFGHRGRRSGDGMRVYRWRVDDVVFAVEYRLRCGSSLELELAHESVPRLLPQMILATPTSMELIEHDDVAPAVSYIGAWLEECAHLVRFGFGLDRPSTG